VRPDRADQARGVPDRAPPRGSHRYIKAIDLTLDGRVIPEVDDLCSLSLDLWEGEQGYERLEPSLAGV
jgi:formate dehydrogenase maturation protein FdhE